MLYEQLLKSLKARMEFSLPFVVKWTKAVCQNKKYLKTYINSPDKFSSKWISEPEDQELILFYPNILYRTTEKDLRLQHSLLTQWNKAKVILCPYVSLDPAGYRKPSAICSTLAALLNQSSLRNQCSQDCCLRRNRSIVFVVHVDVASQSRVLLPFGSFKCTNNVCLKGSTKRYVFF